MKKINLPLQGLYFLLLITVLSCQKNESPSEIFDVQNLKTGKPLRFETANKFDYFETGGDLPGGNCNCDSHGGSTGGTLSWTLATCKTNCQKGIGFRCGRQGILRCQDGTIIICTWGSNCGNNVADPGRQMEANYEFYENETMKLTFSKPVPSIEKNSSTGHIFEVETADFIKFATQVFVNGNAYNGFDILKGNYQINYDDGRYGSVVIGIQFKN